MAGSRVRIVPDAAEVPTRAPSGRRDSHHEIEAHTNRQSMTGLSQAQESELMQQQRLDERRRSFAELNAMLDKGVSESRGDKRKASFGAAAEMFVRPAKSSLFDGLLETQRYRIFVVVITLVALFAFDFTLAFLPSSVDLSTTVILVAVLLAFVVDISINVALRGKRYFLTFYFWLDIIGTASLLPDIIELLDLLNSGPTNALSDDLGVARAGRAGRVARSAGTLRLAKFAKFFRIVRLVRVVRIFRVIRSSKAEEGMDETSPKPSKIGILLSDIITKRVIIIVICLILVVPQFTYNAKDMYTMRPLIPTTLEMLSLLEPGSATFNASTALLLRDEPGIIFMRVGKYPSNATRNDLWRFEDLRKTMEVAFFCYPECELEDADAAAVANATGANTVDIIIDVSEHVKMQSVMQMCLAMFIVVVFAAGSFVISHETNMLIVKPIERMTGILRKLAGTVFVLSMAEDENFDQEDMEIDMLEQIVGKMAEIFNVVPSKGGGRAAAIGGANKGLSMLAGRKYTEISTPSTVYKIDVKEEPKLGGRSQEHNQTSLGNSFRKFTQKKAASKQPSHHHDDLSSRTVELPGGQSVPLSDHPELCDLTALLKCPGAAYELKLFMNQNLMIENFLFWHEVERYRVSMIAHAERVFKSYVSANALTEINIRADVRSSMTSSIFDDSAQKLGVDVFNAAQQEVFSLMRDNAFMQFLSSPFCARYVFKKLAIEKKVVLTGTSSRVA